MWWLAALAACGDPDEGRFDGEDEPTDAPAAGDDDDVAPGDDWPEAWRAFEDDVLALVNDLRRRGTVCGTSRMPVVPVLEPNAILRTSARLHSEDMAVNGFFSHYNPDRESPQDRMADAGYDGAQPWSENIAAGAPTPETVVDLWEDSPGHCRAMMLRDHAVLGVGYYELHGDPQGMTHFWTQNFGGSH